MKRKQTSLVPSRDAWGGIGYPGCTVAHQIAHLLKAREADPELGFMARTMALCSMPRRDPGGQLQYERRNGPWSLYMVAGGRNKLPYGALPRLLLSWVCTEAVRTGSRELVLGACPE